MLLLFKFLKLKLIIYFLIVLYFQCGDGYHSKGQKRNANTAVIGPHVSLEELK